MTPGASTHSDGVAWHWEPQLAGSDFYLSLESAVRRHVTPGARVLEVGVGAGYLLSRLNVVGECSCYGIDVLESAMAASSATAQAIGARLSLVRGSGFTLPFLDQSFDIVASFGVIEHFERGHALRLLTEHARVCRWGGLVLVSTPNALDLIHTIHRAALGRRYPYYPERSYTPWELARELRCCGLEPVHADGYAPLWSLRQIRLAYPLTALLHKTGLLGRFARCSHPRLLSLAGNMTLQVARRPLPQGRAK